jgi:hypothetical protein
MSGPALLCAVVGLLAFAAAPALGALQYPLVRQLSAGFSAPEGPVAVDPVSGDTLVADQEGVGSSAGAATVVRVLNASGVLVATWTGANTPAGSFGDNAIYAIAVNATGDVYVTDRAHGVVDVFEATGGYVCQITGAGSASASSSECDKSAAGAPGGAFVQGEPAALAVDQATGDVYVSDTAHEVVDVFSPAGRYLSRVTGAGVPVVASFGEVRSIAVDRSSGDLLLADSSLGVVYVFNAGTGAYLETWNGSAASNTPGAPSGSFGGGFVAVAANDGTGAVYVLDHGDRVVDQLGVGGGYVGQIVGVPGGSAFTNPEGMAVDQPTGDVYVLDNAHALNQASPSVLDVFGGMLVVVPDVSTLAATEVAAISVTLNGEVNPDGTSVEACSFHYGTSTSYGTSTPCLNELGEPVSTATPLTGTTLLKVHADVAGLSPATVYHFRLVAGNANGTSYGGDVEVTTLPVPVIEGAAATNITESSGVVSADLGARVNPEGYETFYRFEYGTSTSYGASIPIPAADIGAGSSDVAVTQHVTELEGKPLEANTTYHWRLVAHSATGTTTTVDHTFIYSPGGGGLPDNRAYELVTPMQKNGALIGDTPLLGTFPVISEDGSRVILTSDQCFAAPESCNAVRSNKIGDDYLFARGVGGWGVTPLAPAAGLGESMGRFASAESGMELFRIRAAPAGEDDFYAREPNGSFVDIGPITPPAQGLTTTNPLLATTADLSHVVWTIPRSQSSTGGGFWPFDKTTGEETVYEYLGAGRSQPVLVGVSGPVGSTDLISVCGTRLGYGLEPLSADGQTVYFTATGSKQASTPSKPVECVGSGANAGVPVPANAVYARIDGELPDAHTVAISAPECGGDPECEADAAHPSDAGFKGASEDGSKAFFLDPQKLTPLATQGTGSAAGETACSNSANQCNLYLYDFARPEGERLIDVSAGDTSGGGPRVQGVVAISKDGSHVYFVAKGVVSGVANDLGQSAVNGADNLYMYERDSAYPGGRVVFIAVLPASDEEDSWLEKRIANVTPEGRFLVFMSSGRLTPDDTGGSGQVFRYDALTGALVRVSIGEGGFNDNGNDGLGAASIVPPNNTILRLGQMRTDPTMSHDGSRVFFMSPVALAPGAVNNVRIGTDPQTGPAYAQNVYEWEQAGADSCSAKEASGCTYLISDGRDLGNDTILACETLPSALSSVCLLGSDGTGANVFFTTADQLVGSDTDTQVDTYDARICEPAKGNPCIAEPPPPLPPCLGEQCHGIPAGVPGVPAAPSVTFNGSGNLTSPLSVVVKPKSLTRAQKLTAALKVCKKSKNKKKRVACERQAKKKYGVAKKSSKKKGK